MKYIYNTISRFLLVSSLIFPASYSVADDNQEDAKINSRDGYYLSLGAGYRSFESPFRESDDGLQIVFNGRYQSHGFFAELASDPSSTKNLPAIGYNFYNTDHWNFDLIAAITDGSTRFSYEMDGETRYLSSKQTRGAGLRALGSWGDTMLQLVALPYMNEDFRSDSAIEYASLWVGHRWQIKNWSLNGLVGAKYRSSGLLDYHFGITENETHIFDEYQPSSGIDYTAQIDLTYPLSKNLLFQIYTRHTIYSDEILNSPITKAVRQFHGRPEKEQQFGILFNYVF
jgi:MipA family protein